MSFSGKFFIGVIIILAVWFPLQNDNFMAGIRYVRSKIDGQTNNFHLSATRKNIENETTVAVAKEDFLIFKPETDTTFIATSDSLKRGTKMVLDNVKSEPRFHVKEAMVKVVLEEKDFFTGETVWVPYSRIKILERHHASFFSSFSSSSQSKVQPNYKVYQPGTYTFKLKAGQKTDHWITFPQGVTINYSFSSEDGKFQVLYDDGEVVSIWSAKRLPKNKYKFKMIAVTDQPKITMVVTSS